MMEYVGYFAILAILGFVGWLIWLGYATTEVKNEVEETKAKLLLTEAEVKKLTKAKLVELADSIDVMVDPKSTKKLIIEEIEKSR
jgi:hypothetical protein